MPAGIKVRVADHRLLIWKGDGSGEYRRMNPTDKECKAAWQAEGVPQDTENGFYLVVPHGDGAGGFVLVDSDEHVEGEMTVLARDKPDREAEPTSSGETGGGEEIDAEVDPLESR